MKIIGVQSRVSPFVIAVVLLLQLSPALAAGQPDAQQATIQGSRFPGIPAPGTETTRDRRRGPVEVTFTKWRTAVLPPSGVPVRHLFKGIVGGDLGAGDFVGEVLDRKVSTACTAFDPPCTPGITPATITGSIIALHAIYEVQVGEHSFTALIQGGTKRRHGRGPAGRRHPCRVADRGAGACRLPDAGRLRWRTRRHLFPGHDSH